MMKYIINHRSNTNKNNILWNLSWNNIYEFYIIKRYYMYHVCIYMMMVLWWSLESGVWKKINSSDTTNRHTHGTFFYFVFLENCGAWSTLLWQQPCRIWSGRSFALGCQSLLTNSASWCRSIYYLVIADEYILYSS